MELQIENVNQNPEQQLEQDQDQDEMDLELVSSSENLMFTICVMPGTTMHINIVTEDRLPEVTWCISTLLIHNGQHYSHTIHNHAMNSELIRTLGLIHEPNGVHNTNTTNMLPQLLMPLNLPRNPTVAINRLLPNLNLAQLSDSEADGLYNFMQNMARRFNNLCESVRNGRNNSPHVWEGVRRAQQTLCRMVILLGSQIDRCNTNAHYRQGDDEDYDDDHQVNDTDTSSYNYLSFDRYIPIACRVFNDSQFNSDDDDDDNEVDDDVEDDDELSFGSRAVDADEAEEIWWTTSSEYDSEVQHYLNSDYDISDIDIEDNESYILRLVGHTNRLFTRMENRQLSYARVGSPVFLRYSNWRSHSCNSVGEPDDFWSDTSSNSEDLNDWQYNEDRSFETPFSGPFRRLIEELPSLTAQEERESDQLFRDLYDVRPYQPFHGIEPQMEPLYSLGRWRERVTLSSNYTDVLSVAYMNHESPFSGNNTHPHSNAFWFPNPNLDPVCDCYNDHDHEPGPGPATTLDSMEDQTEIDETSSNEQIVPLALYLQQTDKLISQIWSTL